MCACECPRGVLGGVFQFFGGRMTSRGQCPRGGACECPRVGAFFKLMTSRGQCPRGGGCAWCSTHPSSDPPPPPGWLATGLMGVCVYVYYVCTRVYMYTDLYIGLLCVCMMYVGLCMYTCMYTCMYVSMYVSPQCSATG